MKILVTGSNGQLGSSLRVLYEQGKLKNCELIFFSRQELDITDSKAVEAILRADSIDAVINAAAYTTVDKAETDVDAAMKINRDGVQALVRACAETGTFLNHVSTDFVFDGGKSAPYKIDDQTNPLGVYGETKLAGELALQTSSFKEWSIIRTGWVYSSHGGNFVKSMLRLMSERSHLNIVSDQIGTPTSAEGLAALCVMSCSQRSSGVFHWSDAGVASWYDFAVAIYDYAKSIHLLAGEHDVTIKPIPASEFPTPAKRPAFSVLDKSAVYQAFPDMRPVHWRYQLHSVIDQLAKQS